MSRRELQYPIFAVSALLAGALLVFGWTPVPVVDDPLVRMPGTQPNQVTLQAPDRCFNCHSGYNAAVEPGFNWQGSMMAQASRDFLFWSCMTVGAQDSIWALGNPNATDICERCHFPMGWLEGRSDPTNASLMTGADYNGVQCDFCHRMWDPFFETTHDGTREGADWENYWDESTLSDTPSQPAADETWIEDGNIATTIAKFAGSFFFEQSLPPVNYTENASGQYYVSPTAEKRASFADANARHQILYSRYHKSKYFCATCHDVSNPILANLGLSGLPDDGTGLITEQYAPMRFFHVERTFSEFMLSDYGQQGGAPTNTEFQAQGAPDITHAAMCQDCHMRDVTGQAASMNGAVLRSDESIEHPQSGLPLHDLTGANAWVSWVLASSVPGSPNYDSLNDSLLNQGPGALTLDLTHGLGVDPEALLAGVDRAKQQMLLAATIKNLSYDAVTGALSFRIQNNGAHRLPSGFPEGRRMFVNIQVYDGESLIDEINPYDHAAGTLKGLDYPYQTDPLGALPQPSALTFSEAYMDELVYEMKPSSKAAVPNTDGELTGEAKTFHFALATGRYKDNRIPPRGFDHTAAPGRHAETVYTVKNADGTYSDSGGLYYQGAEYAAGIDEIELAVAPGADRVDVNLYYQTTSREYIEFLRDEINGTGNLTLQGDGAGGEPAYLVQTDPFFSQLKAWGDTIWQLWTNNMGVPGAEPFLMASASVGGAPACAAPVPTLLSALGEHKQVSLEWSDEHTAEPAVVGYNVYYDQAGKAQLVAELGPQTTYVDLDLLNDQQYCYKITTTTDCESGFSNILCATPATPQQLVGVASVTTVPNDVFAPGDKVNFEALVVDEAGLPVAGAVVDLSVTGPAVVSLASQPSDAAGIAVATWSTRRTGRFATPTGGYTATVTNVTAADLTWDGVATFTAFEIQ